MSVDLFIFAVLLLINALMTIAMLLASRTLGQPRMAKMLAAAFGCNVLLYIADPIYYFYFRGNPWVNLLVSIFATTTPVLAAMAYRMRSGLPHKTGYFLTSQAIALLTIFIVSSGYPDRGVSGAIVPFYAAAVLLFGVTSALLRPGRQLLLGERPIIFTCIGMAAVETAGGLTLALIPPQGSELLDKTYTIIVFLGLPAMTVAAGIFSLYLMGGDLAERLRLAADTDSLTGAPNRRAIEASGTRLMQEANAFGRPLTVAICDVDHFKDINDLYGHSHGDAVLCQITALFRETLVEPEQYGRFGGEEFVLFFPGADTDRAREKVEDLRLRIARLRIGDLPLRLTASFGIAPMSASDQILSDVIKRADRALYASKEAGRNRTTVDRQVAAAF
ncbi:GGDEF domain-containing protein [Rhizorhabdus sp. FW153]|uniref:GGDEF domain-containing protein n=1 Tax=Rhizorhabdus sp. FW153 TaxID=3400216 RepID=UPI003CFB23EF